MSRYCADCEAETHTSYGGVYLCEECHTKRKQAELEEKSQSLKSCSDFKAWNSGDMSELFWMHLGKYVKEPNERSLSIIRMAYLWACHDNRGLANSFYNAMRWAKVDYYTEQKKFEESKKRAE